MKPPARDPDNPPRPRRMHPEAIAMRRIVVEMGFWLSPLLRDEPIPTLTEYERTVDLQKLARNGTPAHLNEKGLRDTPKPDRAPRHGPNGSGRSSAYKPHTLLDIRRQEERKNERRQQLRAKQARTQPPSEPKPAPIAEPEPEPKPKRERKPERKTALALHRAAIAALSPEEKAARRRERERERHKRRKDAKRTPERAAELAELRSLTPEQKLERRRQQKQKARARHAEKLRTDPAAAELHRKQKRERQRKQTTALGKDNRPYRWRDEVESTPATAEHLSRLVREIKDKQKANARAYSAKKYGAQKATARAPLDERPMPTARQLREEAIYAAAIEAANRRRR